MRDCFVHVGTHKTATTSLQRTLNLHPTELESFGFIYPKAGRPPIAPDGHHNIAWEISGDPRFRSDYGDFRSLLREIEGDRRHVILSSEEFESSAHNTARFSAFADQLQKLNLRIRFVVVLRNQIDYAESLYCTLIVFGLQLPFSEFCDQILKAGAFRSDNAVFEFDYRVLLDRLQAIDGAEVIVRSYDAPPSGSTIADFFSVVGISPAMVEHESLPRLHLRPSLAHAAGVFVRNHAGRYPSDAEFAAIRTFLSSFGNRQAVMSMSRQKEFASRFRDSNSDVCSRYGLPEFERMLPHRLRADDCTYERIFGTELIRRTLRPAPDIHT